MSSVLVRRDKGEAVLLFMTQGLIIAVHCERIKCEGLLHPELLLFGVFLLLLVMLEGVVEGGINEIGGIGNGPRLRPHKHSTERPKK